MDDKKLDALFREKLSNHEIQPSPNSWFKLAPQLDEEKKSRRLIWGNYAAGFLILLGMGIGIQYRDRILPDLGKEMVTEIPSAQVPVPSPLGQVEKVTVPEVFGTPYTAPTDKPTQKEFSPSTPTPTDRPGNQVASLPIYPLERKEIPLPPLDQREEVSTDGIAFEQVLISIDMKKDLPEVNAPENGIAYTVKIVSRGYAIAPDKGQLVEDLENKLEKIGGFLTKVDKGFGDLQDAKNELLFQVMARKKEK